MTFFPTPRAQEARVLQHLQAALADGQDPAADGPHLRPHLARRHVRDRLQHSQGQKESQFSSFDDFR